MRTDEPYPPVKLSIVVPCFNEEQTLATRVSRILEVPDETLSLEVILVDDCSSDRSLTIAEGLAGKHPEIRVLRHAKNQGKGAAPRTGFPMAASPWGTCS